MEVKRKVMEGFARYPGESIALWRSGAGAKVANNTGACGEKCLRRR